MIKLNQVLASKNIWRKKSILNVAINELLITNYFDNGMYGTNYDCLMWKAYSS